MNFTANEWIGIIGAAGALVGIIGTNIVLIIKANKNQRTTDEVREAVAPPKPPVE